MPKKYDTQERRELLIGLDGKLRLLRGLHRQIRELERTEAYRGQGLSLNDHFKLCELKRDFRRYAEER